MTELIFPLHIHENIWRCTGIIQELELSFFVKCTATYRLYKQMYLLYKDNKLTFPDYSMIFSFSFYPVVEALVKPPSLPVCLTLSWLLLGLFSSKPTEWRFRDKKLLILPFRFLLVFLLSRRRKIARYSFAKRVHLLRT
jgi:hypothetical protein